MPWSLKTNAFAHLSTVGWIGWGMVLLMIWSLIWKGLALWHASRRGEKVWFILFLIFNTAGILEIIYLLFVAKIFRPVNKKIVAHPKRKRAK